MKKQIPNLFTLLNLFFGCIAIVFALQTENINIYINEESATSFNLPESLSYASILLFTAALVDFLDGFVARLFKADSAMGKQLDSLADVVSFGVAPGVILYQLLRMSFMKEENGLNVSIGWLLPAFIFTCAGAYRLARFNLDTTQVYGFKGVPIPAAGLVVASLPLIYWYSNSDFIYNLILNKWFLYSLIILLKWLAVPVIFIAYILLSLALKNKTTT